MTKETTASTGSNFYDLSEDTIKTIKDLLEKMAMPFNLKIKFTGDTKLKKLVKLQKHNPYLAYLTPFDLTVFINEDYFIKLEATNAEILIYQELDRLAFNLEKGGFKIVRYPLQTTTGVLKKYGIDAVAEANELSELYTKQVKDGQNDKDGTITPDNTKKTKKKSVEFLN